MVKVLRIDSSILLVISLILVITIFVLNSVAFNSSRWFDQKYHVYDSLAYHSTSYILRGGIRECSHDCFIKVPISWNQLYDIMSKYQPLVTFKMSCVSFLKSMNAEMPMYCSEIENFREAESNYSDMNVIGIVLLSFATAITLLNLINNEVINRQIKVDRVLRYFPLWISSILQLGALLVYSLGFLNWSKAVNLKFESVDEVGYESSAQPVSAESDVMIAVAAIALLAFLLVYQIVVSVLLVIARRKKDKLISSGQELE